MNIDKIVNDVLNDDGKMLSGDQLFTLEGHSEIKIFRVRTLQEFFHESIFDFTSDVTSGYNLLGVFPAKKTWKFSKNFTDNLTMLKSSTHYVIEADSLNHLEVQPYQSAIDANTFTYAGSQRRRWSVLGIFNDKEAASKSESAIRKYFKDQKGNIVGQGTDSQFR